MSVHFSSVTNAPWKCATPSEHNTESNDSLEESSLSSVLSPPSSSSTAKGSPDLFPTAEDAQVQGSALEPDAWVCPETDIKPMRSDWLPEEIIDPWIWTGDDLKMDLDEMPSLDSTCSSINSKVEPAYMQMNYPFILHGGFENDTMPSWCNDSRLLLEVDDPTAEDCIDLRLPSLEQCGVEYTPGYGRQRFAPEAQSSVSDSECMSDASAAHKQHVCRCGSSFAKRKELEQHAKEAQHKPFRCDDGTCTKSFARRDALLRHRIIHETEDRPIHECTQCQRYQGEDAFKRRDHLVQHVEKVHPQLKDQILSPKYCNVPSCRLSQESGNFGGFEHWKDHARHMRAHLVEVRKDCEQCGCVRGFARQRDVQKHMKNSHECRK